jgi:hypothetical protein
MAGSIAEIFVFCLLNSFKSLRPPSPMFMCTKEKEKENKKKKKKERALRLAPRYITPCLVSFFPTPPILVLLVGRGVTTQVLSNNHNTNSKKKFKNSKPKEIYRFQH